MQTRPKKTPPKQRMKARLDGPGPHALDGTLLRDKDVAPATITFDVAAPCPLEDAARVRGEVGIALDARRGTPTSLKTLSQLKVLGRPHMARLRDLFNNILIPGGYVKAAARTHEGLLKSVELRGNGDRR